MGWVPWPERDDEWERSPPVRVSEPSELTVDWTPPETVAVFYDANGDVLIELTDEPVVGFARWLDDD